MGSELYVVGLAQAVNAPVSSLHSKATPVSLDVNVKVAVFGLLLPDGPPVIEVFGATVSTVHVLDAGDASVLPVASFARTRNVCEPLARPEYAFGLVQAAEAPPSMRHSKVEPPSSSEHVNVAAVD